MVITGAILLDSPGFVTVRPVSLIGIEDNQPRHHDYALALAMLYQAAYTSGNHQENYIGFWSL
jgi:hypothetical protein